MNDRKQRQAKGLREVEQLTARVKREQSAMRATARKRRRVMLELHDAGLATYPELAEALGSQNKGFIGRELTRARQEQGDSTDNGT